MIFGRIRNYFAAKKEDKEEFSRKIQQLLIDVSKAEEEYKALFATQGEYIDISRTIQWRNKHAKTHDDATSYLKDGMIEKRKISKKNQHYFAIMGVMYERIDKHRKGRNKKVVAAEEAQIKEMLPTIEQYQLDAITARDKIVLFTGAPSTGKTTALKIKYDRLAVENTQKILLEGGDIAGFAKLAADIVEYYRGQVWTVNYNIDRKKWLREYLQKSLQEKTDRRKIIDYYLNFHKVGKTRWDFSKEADYEKYIELCPPTSLKGEEMRSCAQVEIADFLCMLGIDYQYNAQFVVPIMDHGTTRRYNPAFILSQDKICIDLVTDGQQAGDAFIGELCEIYKNEGYSQIVCCEKDLYEGTLQQKLQKQILSSGAAINALTDDDIWTIIDRRCPVLIDILTHSLLNAFISIRLSGITAEEVVALNRTKSKTASRNYKRNERLLSIILPAVDEYKKQHSDDEFTAIEEALRCLAGAQKPLEYKQIFIDNFQNINSLSNKLLRAIIDNCGCNLFACGTDWTAETNSNGANTSFLQEFSRFYPGGLSISADKFINVPEVLFKKIAKYIKQDGNRTNYRAISRLALDKTTIAECFTLVKAEKDETLLGAFESIDKNTTVLTGIYDKDAQSARVLTDNGFIYKAARDLDKKYDTVVWLCTRYTDYAFGDMTIENNNVAELVNVSGELYPAVADRNMLCKAAMKAKKRFIVVFRGRNVSDEMEDFVKIFTEKN